jgi:hypothetical protein
MEPEINELGALEHGTAVRAAMLVIEGGARP